MLSSFEIVNFRTFRHFRIERLARVNLIVGKNGVGKTTLLEALRCYGGGGLIALRECLVDHDEWESLAAPGEAVLDVRALFHGRNGASSEAHIGLLGDESTRLRIRLVDVERIEESDGGYYYGLAEERRAGSGAEILEGAVIEYKNRRLLIPHFCAAHGIRVADHFDIHPPGGEGQYQDAGDDRLLDQVPLSLRTDIERLAVILDADENAETRWIQLRDRLRRAGFAPVPDVPEAAGTIMEFDLETRVARLGVWIMPDNRVPGILEKFLAWLVPAGDKILPHVDRFLDGIPSEDWLFPAQLKPKARIHAFLAVQREPGKPLGLAITFRYLDARKEIVRPFLTWLQATLIN